jgi:hypothetical protein
MSHFVKVETLRRYKQVADEIIQDPIRLKEVVDLYFSIDHDDKSFKCYESFGYTHIETMILQQRQLYENMDETVCSIESRIMSFNDMHPINYTSHASFNFATNNNRYNFNHYKFYIFLHEDYQYTDEYVLDSKDVNFPMKRLWQYAMCLWYQRNMIEQKESWPGSCTGFTDFLFYCIVGDTLLSISKTFSKEDKVYKLQYYKKQDEVKEKEI